jgi:hypothetical protein
MQQAIARLVGVRINRPRRELFEDVRALASGTPRRREAPLVARAAIPYLNEPWYC